MKDFTPEVIMISVETITPYSQNAKKHDPTQIEFIAKLITEHGWDVPIVLDENLMIIKGHGRWLAAQYLGMSEIPCIIRTDLTETQAREVRLADNRAAEMGGGIDKSMLNLELSELNDLNIDMTNTGYDIQQVIVNEPTDINPEDYEPTSGDQVYALKVICKDNESRTDLLERLTGEGLECEFV